MISIGRLIGGAAAISRPAFVRGREWPTVADGPRSTGELDGPVRLMSVLVSIRPARPSGR